MGQAVGSIDHYIFPGSSSVIYIDYPIFFLLGITSIPVNLLSDSEQHLFVHPTSWNQISIISILCILFMYLSQVLLKGANGDELKKVKHVLQYGIFAAYHLALETCFLADEGASLPELPLKSPITVALPIKPSCTDKSISTIPGFTVPATCGKPQLDIQSPSSVRVSDLSVQPINPFISKMDVAITPHTSNSPHSQLTETSTLFVDLKQLPAENSSQFLTPHAADMVCLDHVSPLFSAHPPSPYCTVEKQNRVDFDPCVDNRRMLNNDYGIQVPSDGGVLANYIHINDRKMMADQQYSSDLSSFHQDNRCNDHAFTKEEFPPSPSDHQSILVSLSTRCVWKGTVCERANLLRIKYYGSFDKPLGRFLRDTLFDQVRLFIIYYRMFSLVRV